MYKFIRLAANALPGEKSYILFAGAGVSKDAGIPTAWDLMLETAKYLYFAENPEEKDEEIDIKDVEKWFIASQYADLKYSEIIDEIHPTPIEQQNFLDEFLGKRKPGEAHKAIAEMARRGIIRGIITTNFDHCLENALKEKGLDVQVISNDDLLDHSEPLIQSKKFRIYKPHGTLDGGEMRNTPKDLESLDPRMEKELIRIISEHGVIVIGYSGSDQGMMKVISSREKIYYPLFWVNPSRPTGEAGELCDNDDVIYLSCEGAGAFLNDFLTLQDRIRSLVPGGSLGTPSIADLKAALSGNEPALSYYEDFLKGIYKELEDIKPDFSLFTNYDDTIINQIDIGENISFRFIEAVQLVLHYDNLEVLKKIYEFFGEFLKLYDHPRGFSGNYNPTDFDGYKFLIHEMFLCFAASIIKFDKWEYFEELLSYDLFTENYRGHEYKDYSLLDDYIESLDGIRKNRLQLNRYSISTDILIDNITKGKLSNLLSFIDVADADNFLFQYSAFDHGGQRQIHLWKPKTSIYLEHEIPRYLKKAESKRFLERLVKALGLQDSDAYRDGIQRNREAFSLIYQGHPFKSNPFEGLDVKKLGSRP